MYYKNNFMYLLIIVFMNFFECLLLKEKLNVLDTKIISKYKFYSTQKIFLNSLI